MKKALPILLIGILILVVMEGVSWIAFRSSEKSTHSVPESSEKETKVEVEQKETIEAATPDSRSFASAPPTSMGGNDGGSFPQPSTEVVNGVTERTIHMGVRQYEWDPKVIRAKQGELVRLIVHNADVKHGIAIPELGVNEDIPPDGAVVAFKATKRGAFEFFCSVWCGEGHMAMTAKLIIE